MSNIERTEAVWNPVAGCAPDLLTQPLRWRDPWLVVVNSTSDLFDEAVPTECIDRVFAVMALCPQHTFQVLTHRPERMAEYLAHKIDGYDDLDTCSRVAQAAVNIGDANMLHFPVSPDVCYPWPLPNVWLGASVSTQDQANARIPHLLRCPAALRFLSCDPLLERVDLVRAYNAGAPGRWTDNKTEIGADWVIVAGEAGPRAWPCNVEWIRRIISQCAAAGVPCYVRQLGSRPWSDQPSSHHEDATDTGHRGGILEMLHPSGADSSEWPADLRVRQWPRSTP